MLDLAVIGSGPAALSAAIYAARAGLSVEVFEKGAVGGALSQIAYIENYPGFVGVGSDLADKLKQQAFNCGAKIRFGEVSSVLVTRNPEAALRFEEAKAISAHSGGYGRGLAPEPRDDGREGRGDEKAFVLQIDDGVQIECRAVLVTTGSEPKPLEISTKTPVSYCAICDGALYKGKNIAVVGGGNSAVQESLHLAGLVEKITVFSRSTLKAEPYLIDKLARLKNVKIVENHEPTTAELDSFDGIFVFIGKRPATTFLPKEILDEDGYIVAKNYETEIPGLFAAGDVRKGSIKQAVTAAAEGAAAALKIIDHLKSSEK